LFSSVLGDSVADPGVDGALNGADALFKGEDVLAGCDEALGDESVFGSGESAPGVSEPLTDPGADTFGLTGGVREFASGIAGSGVGVLVASGRGITGVVAVGCAASGIGITGVSGVATVPFAANIHPKAWFASINAHIAFSLATNPIL
jgi:hypothetical protein